MSPTPPGLGLCVVQTGPEYAGRSNMPFNARMLIALTDQSNRKAALIGAALFLLLYNNDFQERWDCLIGGL